MKKLILTVLLALVFIRPANAEIIKGYPDVIVCDFSRGKAVVYIHAVLENGTAAYFSLNGQSLNVSPQGIVQRKGASCDGKHVDDMRKAGKAFDTVKSQE